MRFSLLVAGVLIAVPAAGQLQVHVGPDGRKVITNIGTSRHASDDQWLAKQRNRRSRYDAMIDRYADRYDVDPVLVRAVILVESAFDPNCVSRRGARGLMQLMPETAARYGVKRIFDPDENIRGGVHYLSDLMQLFPNDLPRVLAAYNAGENAVIRYAGIPPYQETATYVKRALTVYYGTPWGQAVWIRGSPEGRKLGGGFGSGVLAPIAALPGMRILGTR
ncbi:MAG TPA: lytic transglycosylase domain-containing protein [Thermoanaerobaculia bacterium]|nr:lytic transglycosylase domain-containing protein [Thermoanaerobaculia bacterium]